MAASLRGAGLQGLRSRIRLSESRLYGENISQPNDLGHDRVAGSIRPSVVRLSVLKQLEVRLVWEPSISRLSRDLLQNSALFQRRDQFVRCLVCRAGHVPNVLHRHDRMFVRVLLGGEGLAIVTRALN